MSDLAHDLCTLIPDWDIDWPDGSGAARYGPFICLFDSHSNVIVYDVPADNDGVIRHDLDVEGWLLFDRYPEVDEPDYTPAEGYAYVRAKLNLPSADVVSPT